MASLAPRPDRRGVLFAADRSRQPLLLHLPNRPMQPQSTAHIVQTESQCAMAHANKGNLTISDPSFNSSAPNAKILGEFFFSNQRRLGCRKRGAVRGGRNQGHS